MTDAEERYRRIADLFTARVGGVPPDRWSDVSPCPDWTAAGVVAHVVNTHRRVLAGVNGTEPVEIESDSDPDELARAWQVARTELSDALADPERSAKVSGGMFGEQSFETLVSRLVCTDTLIHTWDLARATGQDETLDPAAMTASLGFLEPIDEHIRVPGGFAPKIEPADGADEQTRFLNFCGRPG